MSDETSAHDCGGTAASGTAASPRQPWETAAAFVTGGLLVLLGYHLLIDATRTWDFNAIRLQRSFALAAGAALYPAEASGPILLALYGPVGALAYLPATVLRTPASAVLAGQALSFLFVLLPAALLCRGSRRAGPDSTPRGLGVAAFLLFAALVIDLRPLEYVAFTIHVDAPALALGLLAWAALLRARPGAETRWLVAAAACASLAVWTKLMMLPLLAALPAWVLLTAGWRPALRLAGVLAAMLALVSALVVLAFGPLDRLVFNTWTLPSLQTVGAVLAPGELLRGAWRLLAENAAAWGLWISALALRLRQGVDWRREPASAYGFAGLVIAPFAIAGLLKIGGDVNALAYTSYFVSVGAVLSWREAARHSLAVRRILAGLPVLVLTVVALFQEPDFLATWRQPLRTSELPHQIAYEYAKQHPHEMYFPRITLASFLAEGRIYHQSVGLLDRKIVGLSPSAEHLRAHLPADLQGIALVENGFMLEIEAVDLPDFRRLTRDEALPGFLVYRRLSESGDGEQP